MIKKLLLVLIGTFFAFSQTIDSLGFRNVTGGADIVDGDSIEVRVRYSSFDSSTLGISDINRFFIVTYSSAGLTGTRDSTVVSQSSMTQITATGGVLLFRAELNLNTPSHDSYHVALRLVDGSLQQDTVATGQQELNLQSISYRDLSARVQTGFNGSGAISDAFTVSDFGLREGDNADDDIFIGDGSSDDSVSVRIEYTGQDPSSLTSVELVWYDGQDPNTSSYESSSTKTSAAGPVTINTTSDFIEFKFELGSAPASAESFQVAVQMQVGDKVLSYITESSGGFSGVSAINSAPTGYDTYGRLFEYAVITELGMRSENDENQYLGRTDSIKIRLQYTTGTAGSLSSAHEVIVRQYDNGGVLGSSNTYSNVVLKTDSGEDSLAVIAPTFDGDLDSLTVSVQLENGGVIYKSSTLISGGTLISTLPGGDGTFFRSLASAAPVVQKLGQHNNSGETQTIGLSGTIDIAFEIGANQELGSSINEVRIHQFDGDVEQGSAVISAGLSVSGGPTEYTVSVSGPTSWENIGVDTVAVSVQLESGQTLYATKSQVSGSTHISDASVTGTYFSNLIRSNAGPNAPTNLSFRYGAPNDDLMHFTWTDGTAGDANIDRHLLIWHTSAISGDTTLGTKVTLGANQGTDYDLSFGAGSGNVFVSIFAVDENNEVAESSFGSFDRDDGLTINIAASAASLPLSNILPGTTNNNELLTFTLSRTGTFTNTDSANVSSITFTTAQTGNVTGDTLSNLTIYDDSGTVGVYDGGESEVSTNNPSFTTSSVTVNMDQDVSLGTGSVNLLLTGDVVDGNGQQTVTVSINSSSDFAVSNNSDAAKSGSVSAQGAGGGGDITLPVSIADFSAERVKDGFNLLLETAQEDNVKYIIFQRSTANKPIEDLVNSDWEDTGIQIESSADYSTSGRAIPAQLDRFDFSGVEKLRYRVITEELSGEIKTDQNGNSNILEIDDDILNVRSFRLNQNYPNPFNPSTTISFDVPYTSNISITIYSLLGQKVRTLLSNERFTAGSNKSIIWNGRNDFGRKVTSGIYVYRIATQDGSFLKSKKMVLIK